MQPQIPRGRAFSCGDPPLTPTTSTAGDARSGARRRVLQAAPEEVRQPPEHAGGRRPAPRLWAIARREVSDERRTEVDGEAGVGPLLSRAGTGASRSEERRVGKECRSRWSPYH